MYAHVVAVAAAAVAVVVVVADAVVSVVAGPAVAVVVDAAVAAAADVAAAASDLGDSWERWNLAVAALTLAEHLALRYSELWTVVATPLLTTLTR